MSSELINMGRINVDRGGPHVDRGGPHDLMMHLGSKTQCPSLQFHSLYYPGKSIPLSSLHIHYPSTTCPPHRSIPYHVTPLVHTTSIPRHTSAAKCHVLLLCPPHPPIHPALKVLLRQLLAGTSLRIVPVKTGQIASCNLCVHSAARWV